MNHFRRPFINLLGIGVAVLFFVLPLAAQQTQQGAMLVETTTTVTSVTWVRDESPVEDAEAVLTRMEHGIAMSMQVGGLRPGDVYTIWWIIFNLPEKCSDDDCGQDDVFLMNAEGDFILDGFGRRQFNRPSIEDIHIANMWAAGSIVDEDGTVRFEGHLPIGDTITDVVFGSGLLYPMTAEIHLIARTHGPVQPGLLDEQLLTAWGGCPNPNDRTPCADMLFARFQAPS
jgi:hypothetical protein